MIKILRFNLIIALFGGLLAMMSSCSKNEMNEADVEYIQLPFEGNWYEGKEFSIQTWIDHDSGPCDHDFDDQELVVRSHMYYDKGSTLKSGDLITGSGKGETRYYTILNGENTYIGKTLFSWSYHVIGGDKQISINENTHFYIEDTPFSEKYLNELCKKFCVSSEHSNESVGFQSYRLGGDIYVIYNIETTKDKISGVLENTEEVNYRRVNSPISDN